MTREYVQEVCDALSMSFFLNDDIKKVMRFVVDVLKQPEVVYCRNCKYGQKKAYSIFCTYTGFNHNLDHYCADGKPKGNNK